MNDGPLSLRTGSLSLDGRDSPAVRHLHRKNSSANEHLPSTAWIPGNIALHLCDIHTVCPWHLFSERVRAATCCPVHEHRRPSVARRLVAIEGQPQPRYRVDLRHWFFPIHRVAVHLALLFAEDEACQRAPADSCFRGNLHGSVCSWHGCLFVPCTLDGRNQRRLSIATRKSLSEALNKLVTASPGLKWISRNARTEGPIFNSHVREGVDQCTSKDNERRRRGTS